LYGRFVKPLLDRLLAVFAIIVLSPLLIVVAILIKVGSEGPIFFRQERPGKNQEIFRVYKFRTMVKDAVRHQKVGVEVTESDVRITPFGKFLRRFKIDELAQLINIFKGDMSIVGPRPTLPEYIEQYEEWELERFDVRPGLTGLAQINGNIYLSRQEKSAYDVKYIENISFINDIKIILKTIAIVFFGEDKFINKGSKLREENSDK
jgi:undecaprenyl phosphate N,N'-diacetylbacillosamine 1-phosphate transferase